MVDIIHRPLYKGHFSRSQIIGFPLVLVHFEPVRKGQPLYNYNGHNSWIYISQWVLVQKFYYPAILSHATVIQCRGPGRQCCYDECGRLILGPAAGGHSDFSSPYSRSLPPSFALLRHLQRDITPFLHCCKSNETSCTTFYKFRSSAISKCQCQYSPPPPGSLLTCSISNCIGTIQCYPPVEDVRTIECSWRSVTTWMCTRW